jgi:uncharacterized 2Fe-2S/4Fe-4S cluster protein (DUF4445 family)
MFEPDGKRVSIHAGATLLEAAGQAGIILDTICGGKGTCKKCVVNLRRKASPSGEPDSKAVLACQYHIESDVTVTIPPASRFFEQKILTEGTGAKVQGRPDVWEKYRDKGENIFGLAVDIGTTTVVVKLLNMKDGRCIATEAELNPQTQYGDDVISRIAYAQSDAKLADLTRAIVDCINKLISQLCKQAHANPEHIYEVCVVGNTTMNHIFLGFPVAQLGQAPYRAFSVEAHNRLPDDLKLSINPAGNIYTVENIAGFVGSDITAAALAAGIDSADEMTLMVDIGTNGEIVLGTANKLYAASCAAGPALEGARISCGSRASEGAIEAVIANKNDIDLDVIGAPASSCRKTGAGARSICGSGLIDAVAVLLQLDIIDKSGRFAEAEKLKGRLPPAILSRITEHDGQRAFVLAENRRSTSLKPVKITAKMAVLLTQEDIRQVQLAKAAIRTGIKLLQKKIRLRVSDVAASAESLGVGDDDIRHIYLAGAFGNYIRAESALRIGLLPNVPTERIHFIGNAACSGAQMILLSRRLRTQAGELARKIEYVEIAHERQFADVFAESMAF